MIKSIEVHLPKDTLNIKQWKYSKEQITEVLHISRDRDTIYHLQRKFNQKNRLIKEIELSVKREYKDRESFVPLKREYEIRTK